MARRLILAIIALGVVLIGLMTAVYISLPEWIADRALIHVSDAARAERQLDFLSATRGSTATLLSGALTALTALTAIGTVYASYSAYLSSQDKQLADTLAKATELLGLREVPTRLGGVYVLRRLGRTSAQDYSVAVAIISAQVRSMCPTEPQLVTDVERLPKHPTDVQAMLTFLGEPRGAVGREIVDLSNILLYGLTLEGRVFGRANFTLSQFVSVNFKGADLREADMSGCTFIACRFEGAQLASAVLNDTVFNGVTDLDQSQIETSKGNPQVLLPGNLSVPREWLDV